MIETLQAEVSQHALGRIGDWLSVEFRRHFVGEVVSSVLKLVFALMVLLATSVFVVVVFGVPLVDLDCGLSLPLLIPPLLLAFSLAFHIGRYRNEHGTVQIHGQAIAYTDAKTHLGESHESSMFMSVICFPGWLLFSAFESLANAVRMSSAEPEFCARVLAVLAVADKRVFVPDLEAAFSAKLVPNLKALLGFPGVLVSSRDTPGLMLNAELGAKIREML